MEGAGSADGWPIGEPNMGERFRAIRAMQQTLIAGGPGAQPSQWWNPRGQQDPLSIRRRAVVARGPADNAEVFGSLLQEGRLLPVILRNINMAPFTRQAVQGNTVGLDGFILASCLTSLRVSNRDLR